MLIFASGETQILSVIYDIFPFQNKKVKSTAHSAPTLFNLNSSNTAKSNLYFANSVATAFSNPDIYIHVTFNVPSFISVFYCLYSSLAQLSTRLFVRRRIVSNPICGCIPFSVVRNNYLVPDRAFYNTNHHTDYGILWAKTSDSRLYFQYFPIHTM